MEFHKWLRQLFRSETKKKQMLINMFHTNQLKWEQKKVNNVILHSRWRFPRCRRAGIAQRPPNRCCIQGTRISEKDVTVWRFLKLNMLVRTYKGLDKQEGDLGNDNVSLLVKVFVSKGYLHKWSSLQRPQKSRCWCRDHRDRLRICKSRTWKGVFWSENILLHHILVLHDDIP